MLQDLLLNCCDRYDTSLPKHIEEVIQQLNVIRRDIKHSNEVIRDTNLMVKEKERSSRRIFENLKSIQTGNCMSDKLQEELQLTVIKIENEIGTLMKEKTKNRSSLKEYRKKAVKLEKTCRELLKDELRKLGENPDDTSDESDDFGPDPVLEKYEKRIRKVFSNNEEEDERKIRSTLHKLHYQFANNPNLLYEKVCRFYGEDMTDEDYEDDEDCEGEEE